MSHIKCMFGLLLIVMEITGVLPGTSSARTSDATPYVNGLVFDYYQGEWVKLPDFDQEKIVASGIVADFDIRVRQQDDAFGIRFRGYIKISSSGNYTFYTSSDDGSRLYLNNSLIVDNDGLHTTRERSGSVNLSAGFHLIQVQFFNQQGREELAVKYKGPDFKKQVVPASILYHEPASGLPLPWLSTDIGRVEAAGNAYFSDGFFTIKGSGADIWSTRDEFHFLYWQLSGDGEVIANVASITTTNSWAKAGVMMRESLTDDSRHVFMCVTPSAGTAFQRRIATAGNSFHSGSTGVVPIWLKLIRAGDTFSGYHSSDGLTWINIGSEKIAMSESIKAGLAVTSHNDGALCMSKSTFYLSGAFGEILLTPAQPTLPADGQSVVTISSRPILDFNSLPVPPGTFITVETDLGTIISADANNAVPGIQVKTDNTGTIIFELQAGSEPGVASLAARSVYGDAEGKTSLEFLGDDLDLVATESEYGVITQGQKNIPVALTVKNNGLIISRIEEASLIMSSVSSVSDRQNYVITRVDTISRILPGATAVFRFLVDAQPDADTVLTTIDGQVITHSRSYTRCSRKHQWQVQSPPQLRLESLDALADTVYQGQQGLLVKMEVINDGMASVDSLDARLHFWRQGQDVTSGYQSIMSADNPTLIMGNSRASIILLVNVAPDATPGLIDLKGSFSAKDINSGRVYHVESLAVNDTWTVQMAEGIVFNAIKTSRRYAISGQQEPWSITVAVKNETGVDLALDSLRVEFHIDAKNVTHEYQFIFPRYFLGSQTPLFNDEVEDSLKIDVSAFGVTVGFLEITGYLYCHEIQQQFIVTDASPRGLGYIFIYSPPELQIVATKIDSCPNVTPDGNGKVNIQQRFNVSVNIRNIGDEDLGAVGVTLSSNGTSAFLSDSSIVIPSILKSRAVTIFFRCQAIADAVPVTEQFTVQIDSATGLKSGALAMVNPLSDFQALVFIQMPATLSLSADSLLRVPQGQSFQLTAIVQNPPNYAACDSSGMLTVVLPDSFRLVQGAMTQNFIQNHEVSWEIQAPRHSRTLDSILVMISQAPRDRNSQEPALLIKNSTFSIIHVLASYLVIEQVAITQPPGALDDTLSTDQKFTVIATISSQMVEQIVADILPPNGYSLLSSGITGTDTLCCTWSVKAPAAPDFFPQLVTIQAHGKITNDSTSIYSEPDSSLSVYTIRKANISLHAGITSPPAAINGQIHAGMEFKIDARINNNGDAATYGQSLLVLDVGDKNSFVVMEDTLVPAFHDAVVWTIRAAENLRTDSWVIKVSIEELPLDENSDSTACCDRLYKDIPITSMSGGVNRLELMVKKIADIAPATIAPGETEILLGLECTNLATESNTDIMIRSIKFDTRNRTGNLIYPYPVISSARIKYHEVVCGETRTILGNPVEIPLTMPITIAAQQTANLFFEFDFPENLTQRFKISLPDSSYIDASSTVPVTIVNEYRHAHGMINIESHSPVIVPPNLEQAFANYPNPFGSSAKEVTHFVYYLSQDTDVQLCIYTLLGELVWKCAYRSSDPQGKQGLHKDRDIVWNGRNLKGQKVLNGVYIAFIQTAAGKSATTKIAVLK